MLVELGITTDAAAMAFAVLSTKSAQLMEPADGPPTFKNTSIYIVLLAFPE